MKRYLAWNGDRLVWNQPKRNTCIFLDGDIVVDKYEAGGICVGGLQRERRLDTVTVTVEWFIHTPEVLAA